MAGPAVYLPTQIRRLARIVRAERRVADATTTALEELAGLVRTQLAADGYTAVVVDSRAPEWHAALVERIMPVIEDVFREGFYAEHRGSAVTAAAEPVEPVQVPGGPADRYAGQYLTQVQNRLVAVSDDVFRAITHQLEEGRQATFQVTGRDGVTTTEVGESIPELAKRVDGLLSDGQRWRNRGVTVARTEVISANNAGAHAAAYDNAKLFGAETGQVIKEWLATSDTRTRPTHQTANHQTVLGLGNTFSVGAASMQAPGDPSAPAGEVVNCRCTVLYHYPGDPGYDELAAADGVETGPLPEEAFVQRLHADLEAGRMTPDQLREASVTASDLGRVNAQAALTRYEQTLAAKAASVKPTPLPTPAAKVIDAPSGSIAARHAPDPEVLEALQPQRGGFNAASMHAPGGSTATTRARVLNAIAGNTKATQLRKTLDSFQSGGSTAIPRLRTDIETYLTGGELTEGRRESIENLLGAIGNSDAGDQTLFRGMVIPGNLEDVLARYTAGTDLDLSLASFSSDKKLAQGFSEKGAGQKVTAKTTTPVLIEWVGEGKRALPIQNLAKSRIFWDEKEWVGAGRYRVTGTRTVKRGGVQTVVVTIEQRSVW